MRVLVINGSPRKSGNIGRLLKAAMAECESHGVEMHYAHIASMNVTPCTGCMSCRSTKKCRLPEDDAQRVLYLLNQCDAVIIGSPCYWGNLPGQLKTLFDRMVYGMMDESKRDIPVPLLRGKKAIIISTCTTRWPWNRLFHQSSGVVRALKEILKWSGVKVCATMQRGDTKRSPLTEKDFKRAMRLAHKLI